MILTDTIYGRKKGMDNPPMPWEGLVIEVDTTRTGGSLNNEFLISILGGPYDYDVYTSDGQFIPNNTGELLLSFPAPGIYLIEITRVFQHVSFARYGNPVSDVNKIVDIKQWGNIIYKSMHRAFSSASALTGNWTDAPNLSQCTSLHMCFQQCSNLIGNFSNWNVSNVQDFTYTFQSVQATILGIANWNMSGAKILTRMFQQSKINEDISNWNTSAVTHMDLMFYGCPNFNQPIGNWDVSKVQNFRQMFQASNFTQPLDNWRFGVPTDLYRLMYGEAGILNTNLKSWNAQFVTNWSGAFQTAAMSNYTHLDEVFNTWSQLPNLPNGRSIDFSGAPYTATGQPGLNILTNTYGWTITGIVLT